MQIKITKYKIIYYIIMKYDRVYYDMLLQYVTCYRV